ncbi:MAG: DUF1640 domain-containing protein [Magnetococcales bacterium]|nr:DUF1640 domain-containing protein [Magnetococcales bacterium]
MNAITFDTHEFVKELCDAGFEEKQAEAVTKAIRKAQESRLDALVTKQDLDVRLAELEIRLVKWMVVTSISIIGVLFALLRFVPLH